MSSYKERQEERARKAKVAGSRSRGDARKKMSEYMGKFKAKMGGLRDRMSQPPQQRFGTSALQQAMAQQAMANKGQGVVTPEAQEMVNYHWERNPDEMVRQFGQMKQFGGQGMHGDYGINRMAQPMYADASNSEANMSGSVEQGNQDGVEQRLLLDRMMKDPSKLNAEGIKSMQTTLNSLGFRDSDGNMLDVDGKMGKLTASAMENYRGQLGQGVPENNEPLDSEKVVSGVERDWIAGPDDGIYSPQQQWNPYAMETQSEWDIANQGHGGRAGYQDIQQTIGNPANDPVMWGSEELDSLTNPLQYDFEQGVPYRPKN